jgi:formate--tetrahydrofolate ligase
MLEDDPKYADFATMMVKTHLSLKATTRPDLSRVCPRAGRLPIRDVLIYSGRQVPLPLRRHHQPDAG